MDEDCVGPLVAKTLDSFVAAMSGAVVHDPKDTASGLVGLLAHDFADKPIHGSDSALDFAASENPGPMDIPSCQVGPGAFAKVLVLDAHWPVGSGRQSWMFPASGLNAGFFVRGNDIVVGAERGAFPNALVQIEDRTGFGRKVGIAGEDPASMLPRTEGIAAEPPPQRGAANLRDQALRDDMLPDLLDREPGQRKPEAVRKFTGQRFNLNDEAGGKSGLCARPEAVPLGQAYGQKRIACATC